MITKKTSASVIAGAMALLVSGYALADAPPQHDLKVVGVFEVPGCTVDGDGQGETVRYDYETITPDQIKPGTTKTALDPMSKAWVITCSGTTYLTYQLQDNRSGTESEAGTEKFGLGNVNGENKIGYYQVDMLNGQVRNVDVINPSKVFATTNSAISGADSATLRKGYTMGWSTASNTLAPGDMFMASFRVSPYLAGSATMGGPLTENTQLDGSLTLNFAFGL